MWSSSAAGPRGWPARCGSRSSSTRTTEQSRGAAQQGKYLRAGEGARNRPALPFRSVARSALHARAASWFEKEAPIEAQVTKESVYFLTRDGKFKLPVTPPPLRDHGNYVISLNRFMKWLGEKVEDAGITVFTGFAGSELLIEDDRWSASVPTTRASTKGERKANFEPGYDLQAKITFLPKARAVRLPSS